MYPNVKQAIRDAGMTYDQVADKMYMTKKCLSRRIRGKTAFTVEEAVQFKKIVGSELPLEVLFEGGE